MSNEQTCQMCNANNNDDNNVWECFTLSNGDEHVFCDECKDNCYYEQCAECCVLMGDKLFDEEEEHNEFPDRLAGYDHNGDWCCAKHREPCVDDVDAPNTFPYKKCSVCEMRKSCGNYDEDKRWFCENCFVEEFGEEKEKEQKICEECECELNKDGDCQCEIDYHEGMPEFDEQTFYLLDIIINRNNGTLPNWISLKDVHGKLWTSKNDAWE